MGNRKQHRQDLVKKRAERMERVRQLHWGGRLSPPEIADQIGISPSTVYDDLKRIHRIALQEASAEVRDQLARELSKLEYLDSVAAQEFTMADPRDKVQWFNARLRLHEKIAALLNLGQPTTTINVNAPTTNNTLTVVNIQNMGPDERQRHITDLLAKRERCLAREKRGRSLLGRLGSGGGAGS